MINTIIWNVRGIGCPSSRLRTKNHCHIHNISVLVLLEPLISMEKLFSTANFLGFHQAFANVSNKIWVFWKDFVMIDVIGNFSQVLHCNIESLNFQCVASFVYAASSRFGRKVLWEQIENFHSISSLPWLVGGDFNSISTPYERVGGSHPIFQSMEDFNDMIMNCNLIDIGFIGNKFTWNRCHLWQRLDRVLFNNAWVNVFNASKVVHLSRTLSDHSPLLINVNCTRVGLHSRFRFQNMWLTHDSFLNVVHNNWMAPIYLDNSIDGMARLWFKLKRLKLVLNWWNRHIFKNIFANIKEAKERINELEDYCQLNPTDANWAALKEAKMCLSKLQCQEEIFWKQKAAMKHLAEGDNNTRYFHALVNKKRAINGIHKIARADGSFTDNDEETANLAVSFFQNHLNKNFCPIDIEDHSFIPNRVTPEDNVSLSMCPLMEEVKNMLFDMNAESVVGPDGFTVKFFQHTWHFVCDDVYSAVVDFFNGSPIPKFFSTTSIALIPKNIEVNSWNDFRPISLCSIFYKLISKILVNRLSLLLPKLISSNQMGFVKGRAIVDNILLAQEFCQDLDTKTRGGNMILKLDIAKAYDNINWNFIYKMLQFFGFDGKFISLICTCIESPFFSIILNGNCHGFFKSSHGLRQGDPLSPAIFILAVDYLSRGINDLFSKFPNLYYRTMGGIKISHLCFADDFIVFMNASKNCIFKVLGLFNHFEAINGLVFNKGKSGFVISKNVSQNRIMGIKEVTGFSQASLPLKYLGIPLFKGRKKSFLFDDLISKVHNRLAYWDSKFLSYGGRLVLIKSVLASILVYSFQVLFPTKSVCLRIDRIFNKFFWMGSSSNSKIHWSSWSKCCGTYQEGDLGCKSMLDMATAFSFKLWYNLRVNSSLWANFMTSKYCGDSHPSMCFYSNGNSQVWHRMLKVKWIIESRLVWGLGEGNIFFWQDRWINGFSIDDLLTSNTLSLVKVNFFFSDNGLDVEKLSVVIPDYIINLITNISINRCAKDALLCKFTKDGLFSTKQAWHVFRNIKLSSKSFKMMWHKSIPTTVSVFNWRVLKKFVPTDDMLRKKGLLITSKCQCCANLETVHHVFVSSPIAVKVWNYFEEIFHVNGGGPTCSVFNLLEVWMVSVKGHVRNVIPLLIIWFIWLARNDSRFNDVGMNHLTIIARIKEKILALFSANLLSYKSFDKISSSVEIFEIAPAVSLYAPVNRFLYWSSPNYNCFKLNIHTVLAETKWCIGGLIRNSEGMYIVGFAGMSGAVDNLEGFLMAVLYGLSLCVSLDVRNVVVESYLSIDQSIFLGVDGTSCGHALFYTRRKVLFLTNSLECSYNVVKPEINAAASALALFGTRFADIIDLTFSNLPVHIQGLINLDKRKVPYVLG
ncbi:hypothetical protein KFK09_023657 [Dendrobium nobile]|uniref:Reverse transcriptase domain-containing protein n=1 Tax=Dendrobium nobile TaxID=94219 RepID=A0A8T3ABM4_DENNO|nr:hypothetical protein KFK09_023657 [Dendrobium nobile]